MKNIFLILSFFLFMQSGYAQNALECGYYGKKTVEERNALFPFNKAKKVVLISYPNGIGMQEEIQNADATAILKQYGAIEKLCFSLGGQNFCYLVKESLQLDKEGINRLSNILLNYRLKKQPRKFEGIAAGTLCYDPHNAILFYDENGIVVFCYEVCFDCRNNRLIPDSITNMDKYCQEAQIDEVKELFKDYNIKYFGSK